MTENNSQDSIYPASSSSNFEGSNVPVWKARGLIVEEIKDKERSDGLQEWKLRIDAENSNLSEEEREFLKKYDDLSFHAWGNVEGGIEEMHEAFMNCGLLFAGGLASNYEVWDTKKNSFVTRLGRKLDPIAGKWMGVAIDCPGFGGSALKKGLESVENVSSEDYQKLISIALKVLNPDDKSTVLVGHSSGAEAVLPFSTKGYKVFSCNPAVKNSEENAFKNINALNGIGDSVQRIPAASIIVHPFAVGITALYLGKFGGEMLGIHSRQEKLFWKAFVYKSKELELIDSPLKIAPTVEPTLLLAQGDKLTPIVESIPVICDWFSRFTDSNSLKERILRTIIPISEELSKSVGHNGMYEDDNVAEAVTGSMTDYVALKKGKKDFKVPVLASNGLISSLLDDYAQGLKLNERVLDEIKYSNSRIKELGFITYSLETFANLSEELSKLDKVLIPSHSGDPQFDDYLVTLPTSAIEPIITRVLAHPFLLERNKVEVGNEPEFVANEMKNIVRFFDRYSADFDGESTFLATSLHPIFAELAKEGTLKVIGKKEGMEPTDDLVDSFFLKVRDEIVMQLVVMYAHHLTSFKFSKFFDSFISAKEDLKICTAVGFQQIAQVAEAKNKLMQSRYSK
ncbi:MAG: hypothetical protein UT34_C0001G0306 [candidate division WS6 bacterium GW2011_GWF2_39_15]|uniref:Uncharacterized protein n=1 Tax=candidate division WS6 bacterium GW2011_GWF2_39_15 TaxID=1619100 RepID=A0A0G0N0C1_9BACT|nr:MAG: hypothetical protein UT34_C0001G0306 [candidate division WS6 bacterium GW2011_GWF2_39_15]